MVHTLHTSLLIEQAISDSSGSFCVTKVKGDQYSSLTCPMLLNADNLYSAQTNTHYHNKNHKEK